jgi:ABC-type lipoprotein export system ATPase subunit
MNVSELGDLMKVEIPAVARYHHSALELILQSIEEGVFCALLGPRLSGKTQLLRYIEQGLARPNGWTCAFLNLLELRASTQQTFFSDLIRATAQQLALSGYDLPAPKQPKPAASSSEVSDGSLV